MASMLQLDQQVTGCPTTNKRRYASRVDAMRALYNTRLAGRGEQRFYRCEHCGGHHLTSQTPDAWSDRVELRESRAVCQLAERGAAA